MQSPSRTWIFATTCAALAVGCVVTTTDEDAASARLPTGVTLLESDRADCAGPIAIDEDSIQNSANDDFVVQAGQNATYEIDADDDVEIEWSCVGAADVEEQSIECPAGTSHLRITRASTGDEFLVECFGERGVVASR